MKTIYFVTSNKRKVQDYSERMKELGYQVEQLELDLNEGSTLDIEEITKMKMEQARSMYPDKQILVDDRGFFVNALNGFPGPFIKMFLGSIGIKGMIKLMEGVEDRTATFKAVLGYFDGEKEHYFIDNEVGFLTKEIKGSNLRGWTEILYIYGYPAVPDKSLAEYTDEEWNRHLNILSQNDFLKQLGDHLKSKV